MHRDLKLENIFLDKDYYPKIGGFSLAIEAEEKNHNSVIGAPIYKSPEIIKFEKYTKAGDVYSYGILICFLMTSKNSIQFKNQYYAFLKIVKGYRHEIPSDMPECYHKLITKCWSNQVEERPTFDGIVKELKTNKQFITSTINEDEFRRFADNI